MRSDRLVNARWLVAAAIILVSTRAYAQQPFAVNHAAARASRQSPLVQRAYATLVREANAIVDPVLRRTTVDAIANAGTCVAYRRGLTGSGRHVIIDSLVRAGLLTVTDSGAVVQSLFPPLRDDGGECPRPRQPFVMAAGGNGSHHDYPGGLAVHEAYNLSAALDLARVNRDWYLTGSGATLQLDIIRAATIWHDWSKMLIYVWAPDGTLTHEVMIAGTYSHHIVGLAEAMARGLPAGEVLAQAAAHLGPGRGNDDLIAGWLRAGAILARVDPIARGYLVRAVDGAWHLPPVDGAAVRFTTAPEAVIVNIADENIYSMMARAQAEKVLGALAPEFGYALSDLARYRNEFRNPVLSYLSADRVAMVYRDRGVAGVRQELSALAARGIFTPVNAAR